jgi:ribonucleoside-diphosphate reductase alpha chain
LTNTIDKKITGYKVLTETTPPTIAELHTLERDEVLSGTTYKLKVEDWAYYVTVNDTIVDGAARPFEVFINTKNAERYASLTTLTRLISAYFRTGHAYAFIAEELSQIIDPKGGFWQKGTYYASFEALLGEVLKKHFDNLKTS